MGRSRRYFLWLVAAAALVATIFQSLNNGSAETFPGPMSRHRDAAAVAITAVSYGHWQGYVSFKEVNETLRKHGFSVTRDGVLVTADYQETMRSPVLVNLALAAAANLKDVDRTNLFYMQDEKGMALMYTAAFALFGISATSLFYFHMLLLIASLATLAWTFRHRADASWLVAGIAATHHFASIYVVAIYPHDVNVIQGNRFIALLGLAASAHIMLDLIDGRRRNAFDYLALAFQAALIVLVILCRTSAAWLIIAIALFAFCAWPLKRATNWRPILAVAIIAAAIPLHNNLFIDAGFHNDRNQTGHVFWHNLVSVLHNNPDRGRFGIPPEVEAYDDLIGYTIFQNELRAKNLRLTDFLMNDSDWIYRTSEPKYDFRWDAYDAVIRDAFLKAVAEHPWYALKSFAYNQPTSIIRSIFDEKTRLSGTAQVTFLGAIVLVLIGAWMRLHVILTIVAALTVSALLPAMTAAPVPMRVVDLVAALFLLSVTAGACILSTLRAQVMQQPDLASNPTR